MFGTLWLSSEGSSIGVLHRPADSILQVQEGKDVPFQCKGIPASQVEFAVGSEQGLPGKVQHAGNLGTCNGQAARMGLGLQGHMQCMDPSTQPLLNQHL